MPCGNRKVPGIMGEAIRERRRSVWRPWGRFAPSPSGRIHLGNILCCLLAWLSARQKGGRVVLRIEDLDTARCPARYGEQMCRDIHWLGLDWDEGPGVGGPSGPYEQSRRTALYQAALERLEAQGLVYPCFLHPGGAPRRQRPPPGGRPGHLPRHLPPADAGGGGGAGRGAPAGPPPCGCGCRRRRSPFQTATWGRTGRILPRDCGDFLLRRSDGLFAYQLAVVADDAAMGVTEVVRGADLLPSTPRQLLLYRAAGADGRRPSTTSPCCWTAEGRRLSKRDADAGLDTLGQRCTAPEILGKLAYLAGFQPLGGAPDRRRSCWRTSTGTRCPRTRHPHPRGAVLRQKQRRRPMACAALIHVYSAVGPGHRDLHLRASAPG